ncbi:hypothetical protein V2W45_1469155 [Cenococcum geophilum]
MSKVVNSTQRSGDSAAWKTNTRSPRGKAANGDAVGPDEDEDDRDDDFESGGQSLGSESSGDSDSDASGAADDKVRAHRPWLKSDNERLVAYKSKMGAVYACWYILQGK